MKQSTFEHHHQHQWQTLERWLDDLEQHHKFPNVSNFPTVYRQICQHLALARNRNYTPYLIERLNRLVLRGHQCLYKTQGRLLPQILTFIGSEFPRRVRTDLRLVGLSSLLFFGSLLLMFISVYFHPPLIYSLIEDKQLHEIERMYNSQSHFIRYRRDADSNFLMFGYYIYHNISISFQIFAGGILFCIGTLFFLLFNGLFIGGIAGHLTVKGHAVPFFSFIIGHSALELTAIVLAGVAGMKLGLALIAPGRLHRLHALRNAATHSIHLIYGVIGMLLLAAFIEAFWSSNGALDPSIKYSIGALLWISVIGYFSFVGRDRAS